MSTKTRQWAASIARDCGIGTMLQQTAPEPMGNPAPAIEASREKRRYRRHDADELAAMRLEVHRGAKVSEVAAKYDVAKSIVYRAVADGEPRPERKSGESPILYARRVGLWKRRIDPEAAARFKAAVAAGKIKAAKRRAREKAKAERAATPKPPPPINVEAAQPVAAVEPPWGFEPATRPAEIVAAPPPAGFWRRVGMALGIVR